MKEPTRAERERKMMDRIVEILPELAETVARIKADKTAGITIDAPLTYRGCRNWREAWVYIFHCARHESSSHLKRYGEKITCVVWIGVEFKDKLVDALEKIAARIGVNNDLTELRLIDTRVTIKGIERLKKILPKATIKVYTREEAKKDKKIQYVGTDVGWIKKLYAGEI